MNKYGHWESKEVKLDTHNAFVYKVTLNIEGVDKFYIGYKTTKGNWMEYKTSSRKVKKLWDCVVKAEILEWFDEGQKALEREIELLTEVSAHTNDSYLNMHIGGVKFNTLGAEFSKSTREKISASKKGKKQSAEYLDKKSKSMIGELNHFFGKEHDKQAREKISKARTGCKDSLESLLKKSESRKGSLNPMYGKTHTDDVKNKLRSVAQKRTKGKVQGPDGTIYFSLTDASKKTGIKIDTLRYRIKNRIKGWTRL